MHHLVGLGLHVNITLFHAQPLTFSSINPHQYSQYIPPSMFQVISNAYQYGFPSNMSAANSTSGALSDGQVRLLWSVTISIYCASGMIGALLGSPVAKKIGR